MSLRWQGSILLLVAGLLLTSLAYASPSRELLSQFVTPVTASHTLRVGYLLPDFPPYDISLDNRYYDGINADILTQIAHSERVHVTVFAFSNRQQALAALREQRIDLLTTQKPGQPEPGLQQIPYLTIEDDIIIRKNSLPKSAPLAIALVEGLNNYAEVKKSYPDAIITVYKTLLSAIGSLEFGENTLFIGDAASVGYFSANSLFNHINVIGFLGGQETLQNLAFTLRAEDSATASLLRAGIKKIQPVTLIQILRKWDKSKDFIIPGGVPTLSEKTSAWLKTRPVVRVWLPENNPPWSQYSEGDYQGITVDILQQVANNFSLRLEFMRKLDGDDEPDLLSVHRRRRDDNRLTTRAYLMTPFVVIEPRQPKHKAEKIRLIGLLRANAMRHFPTLRGERLALFDDIHQAYAALSDGELDAVVDSYPSAKYFIRKYGYDVALTEIASDTPLNAAFAVASDNPALYELLNEGILNLAPSQIYATFRKWDTPPLEESFYSRYKTELLVVMMMLVSVSMISLLWLLKLRQQVAISRRIGKQLDNQLLLTQALINGTPHPLYIRDATTRLISCNHAYLSALGVEKSQVMLSPVDADVLYEKFATNDYLTDFYSVLYRRENIIIKERNLTLLDGKGELQMYHWMVPYTDHIGTVRGVVGGWIDISFRKAIEQELQQAKNRADAANREKTRFLAFITHEIRTQLNAIMGMLEIGNKKILEGVIDTQAFDVAWSSSQSLQEIIGNVLDITKIESGRLNLHPEYTDIIAISRQTVDKFRSLAQGKGLKLRFSHASGAAKAFILIDRLRYNQILSNLVNNAIKFTAQGIISVEIATATATDGSAVETTVKVRDTGCGIREEDQPNLFDLYAQFSQDTQQINTGSGLGLHFCKVLLEMMNGTIHIDSVHGEGTVVTMHLLTPARDDVELPALDSLETHNVLETQQKNRRILIVDDFYPNIIVLSKQLTYLGYQVISCSTPSDALRHWQEARPDVVLTDCNMPGFSGFDLARAIRQENANCPIIGLTADARDEQYKLCLQAGMNDCLFKPLSLGALSSALSQYAGATDVRQTDDHSLSSSLRADATFMHTFTEQIEQDLSDLFDALQNDDFRRLLELAHKLKGGFNVIELHDPAHLCEELEIAVRHKNIATCQQLLKDLEEAILAL